MNKHKFDGLADVYEKYRPTYPESLVRYLYETVGFTAESYIADVGAGTGKFAKLLLAQGSFVYGVEFNKEMLAKLQEETKQYTNIEIVNATAEHTNLPAKSIDFVTAAQAFHWFDSAKFANECKRILKPDGKVVLVWNVRNLESVLVQEQEHIFKTYCPHFIGFSGGFNKIDTGLVAHFFKNNTCQFAVFDNPFIYSSKNAFIGRSLSSSYAPKPNEETYTSFVKALEDLFDEYQTDGTITIPNEAVVYWGEV